MFVVEPLRKWLNTEDNVAYHEQTGDLCISFGIITLEVGGSF